MQEIIREYGRTMAGGMFMAMLLLILALPLGHIITGPLEQQENLLEMASDGQDQVVDREMQRLGLRIRQCKECLDCEEMVALEDVVEAQRNDGMTVPLQIRGVRRRMGEQENWEALDPEDIQSAEGCLFFTSGGIYQLLLAAGQGPEELFVITLALNRRLRME